MAAYGLTAGSCFRQPWGVSVLALCILTALGCGGSGISEPEIVPVTGWVTINDEPAAGLDVLFTPVQGATQGQGKSDLGGMSNGRTDELGRYELTYKGTTAGAVVGKHSVQIRRDEANIDAPPGPAIPPKYNSDSILTADVRPDGGDINFHLEVDP